MRHVISKGKVCVDLEEPTALNSTDRKRTVSFLPEQLFVLLAVVWVDFNNWGFMSNLLPFCMKNSTSSVSESSVYLSYALQLSSVCLVIGDLSTYFITIPIMVCLVLFTSIAVSIYASACGLILFEEMGPVFVCLFGFGRFLESHLTTSVFNYISIRMPASMREDAIRFLGLADMIAVTLGVSISAVIVNLYFPCATASADDYLG